jgi:hypothetical protein
MIVSASMANTSSRAPWSPAFFVIRGCIRRGTADLDPAAIALVKTSRTSPSNWKDLAAGSLSCAAYEGSIDPENFEETMSTPPIQNVLHPASVRYQTLQDLLLVSSFGLWAVLLGLTPVLAFHLVMAS